ncbi:MAG: CBS domain-containing protein [Vicingaceae bacterium]
MVKSYQGERIQQEKEIKQFYVHQYMTQQVITFSPEQTIDQVVNVLTYRNISGGPVCDEKKNLVGIISEGDCLKQVMNSAFSNVPSMSGYVKDHMVKEVKTLSPNQTIMQAAEQFLKLKIRRFPVMDEGKLVGQISQRDVMRAFQEMGMPG